MDREALYKNIYYTNMSTVKHHNRYMGRHFRIIFNNFAIQTSESIESLYYKAQKTIFRIKIVFGINFQSRRLEENGKIVNLKIYRIIPIFSN